MRGVARYRAYAAPEELLGTHAYEHDDILDAEVAELTRVVASLPPHKFCQLARELFGPTIMQNPEFIKTLKRKVMLAAVAKREAKHPAALQKREAELKTAQQQLVSAMQTKQEAA